MSEHWLFRLIPSLCIGLIGSIILFASWQNESLDMTGRWIGTGIGVGVVSIAAWDARRRLKEKPKSEVLMDTRNYENEYERMKAYFYPDRVEYEIEWKNRKVAEGVKLAIGVVIAVATSAPLYTGSLPSRTETTITKFRKKIKDEGWKETGSDETGGGIKPRVS